MRRLVTAFILLNALSGCTPKDEQSTESDQQGTPAPVKTSIKDYFRPDSQVFRPPGWSVAMRKPGDNQKDFTSAFEKAKDGCFAKDLKLSKNCWTEALVQKITFMTGLWPMQFQTGTSIFRIYPEINYAKESGQYTCIILKVDGENLSEDDLRDAFSNADSKLRIVERSISSGQWPRKRVR